MLRKRIFRRVIFGPFRKVAGTLANIVVFDIAMFIYRRMKKRIYRTKPEEEEIFFRRGNKRKRGDL